jgi:hypothetical protein
VETKVQKKTLDNIEGLSILSEDNYFFLAAFLGAAFLAAFLGAAYLAAFLGAAFLAA